MSKGKSELKYYLFGAFFAAIVLVTMLFLIILWITSPSFFTDSVLSQKGGLGDAINGITAPFIGISIAILTFLAFYMQFKANEVHNKQFEELSLDKEQENHENKILYLIKKNRNIAVNMSIGYGGNSINGDKCFNRMFNEFRASYEIVNSFYHDELEQKKLNNKDIINISYIIFYNGVGDTSDTLNHTVIKNAPRLQELLDIFSGISKAWLNQDAGASFTDVMNQKLFGVEYNSTPIEKLEYLPFDGHMTRLGQYFRNLFHVLTYTYNDAKLDNDGYELIKTLRSQLSNYEQILICFNSLSLYGMPLHKDSLIEKYKLIKNIPLPLIDFSGDIHDIYKNIKFEWDEVIERANNM